MLNKKKCFLILLAIVSVVLIASSGRLDYPITDRLCYGSELAPRVPVFLCFIDGTEIMEASFLTHPVMNDYYTPQLKEIDLTGGSSGTYSMSVKNENKQFVYGTLTVTGSPSYLYTKWVNK